MLEGFASAPWCDDEVIIKKWMFVAGNVVFIDARWRDPSGCLMMPYDVFDSRFASIQYKQRRSDGGMLHVEPTSNSKLLSMKYFASHCTRYILLICQLFKVFFLLCYGHNFGNHSKTEDG